MHDQPLPPVEAVGGPSNEVLQPEAAKERGESSVEGSGGRRGALGAAEVAEPSDVVSKRLRRRFVRFVGALFFVVVACCS